MPEPAAESEELLKLRKENARLKALLTKHCIPWEEKPAPEEANTEISKQANPQLSPSEKVALSMPISWKGTLQQYAGRLHREHGDKQDVRIYDYVENDQPQLARMWEKRQRGYRAMGYQIMSSELAQMPLARGARMRTPG